jgi:predicted RNA-binding protein YlxR (DUF448 family)
MIARAVTTSGLDRPRTSAPERTCLGCRKHAGKDVLVRLVADGDRVVIDAARSRSGRGAWVHRDRACVSRLEVGAIERGLRTKLRADALTGIADAIAVSSIQLPPASPAEPATGESSRPGHG